MDHAEATQADATVDLESPEQQYTMIGLWNRRIDSLGSWTFQIMTSTYVLACFEEAEEEQDLNNITMTNVWEPQQDALKN